MSDLFRPASFKGRDQPDALDPLWEDGLLGRMALWGGWPFGEDGLYGWMGFWEDGLLGKMAFWVGWPFWEDGFF